MWQLLERIRYEAIDGDERTFRPVYLYVCDFDTKEQALEYGDRRSQSDGLDGYLVVEVIG